MIKPGYKTSEFWFTLVTFVFSGLYLLGAIGDVQYKDELISNVTHAVESCILIGGQLVVLYKYVNGRNNIKQLWWSSASDEDKKKLVSNVVEKGTKNAKKPNTKRNTKTRNKNSKPAK